MPAYLEVWGASGRELRTLGEGRTTLGQATDSDIVLGGDRAVSRVHAALEPYGGAWAIRDLGSRNGTFVNGERILGDRVLRAGDEIRAGSTRMVFHAEAPADPQMTETVEGPPEVTRRERDVLVALCRPVFSGAMFSRPATIKEIAAALFLTENAVKQHLSRLYDKFAIYGEGEPRPVQLANEAIRRGAVSLGDLRAAGEPG